MNPSTPNIRSLWRTLRPSIKEACTFSEIKDIVASAAMPVEQLSHLQQKSLPEKSSSKSELMDAVDILVSKEPDPDEALRRLVVALQQSKPHVKAQGLVESVTAEIITPTGFPQASPLAEGQPEITQSTSLDIFISHSGKDADVAEALIDLIRAALDVQHHRIRCTSVDGYRLPGGASTDEVLQREVRDSRCFIALLTHSSLRSSYVLFELGARWGARQGFIPLLAKGLPASSLERPLSSLNALSCSSSSQVHQLIQDIARIIGKPPASPANYDRQLQCLFSYGVATTDSAEPNAASDEVPQATSLSSTAKEFLELIEQEPDLAKRGIVQVLTEIEPGMTHFFPRIEYGGTPLAAKCRIFRDAISELVSANHLYQPEDNPSTNTRTFEYRSQ